MKYDYELPEHLIIRENFDSTMDIRKMVHDFEAKNIQIGERGLINGLAPLFYIY